MLQVLLGFSGPSLVLGAWLFRSAFAPPGAYRVAPSVAPARVVRRGSSPLRTQRLFHSAFAPPSVSGVARSVAPAQRQGSSLLRRQWTELRHPIDSALRAFGGALLVATGIGVAANGLWGF
jgi:hypothetical protein